jgi:23S rRNA pseudouridine1911/1915/1917 synthase
MQRKSYYHSDYVEAVLIAEEAEHGQRLDQFLQNFFSVLSRQQIKKKIELGEVKIDNRPFPHKSSVKVHAGDTVHIFSYGEASEERWKGELIPRITSPEIAFENDEVLIINKPAFMTTHPVGKNIFYCATTTMEHIKKSPVYSIHRLDKETSGLLVLGKNSKAAQIYSQYFEDRHVKKAYFFIARKIKNSPINFPFFAKENLGTEDDYIPRLFTHCYPENSDKGKTAQTYFEEIYQEDNYMLALAYPLTGRQHQIRAHAFHYGLSLLGDKLYCEDQHTFIRFQENEQTEDDFERMQLARQALHATGLCITPPNKSPMIVFAHLPIDISQWINQNLKIDIKEVEKRIKEKINSTFEKNTLVKNF